MVAISTAPFQQVGDGAAGTADVVRVDVADVLLTRTASQHHRRQPRLGEHVRQRVPGMHGHQQRPVDPAAPRVLQETLPLRIRTDQGQQQLHPGVRQRIPQRADDLGEERLRELPPVRLRQDQGHGIGPTPCQRPRGEIGHVPEFLDSTLHSPARRRLHTGRVVDDTRDRAPPHPRADGHLLQRRPPGRRLPMTTSPTRSPNPTARPNPAHRLPRRHGRTTGQPDAARCGVAWRTTEGAGDPGTPRSVSSLRPRRAGTVRESRHGFATRLVRGRRTEPVPDRRRAPSSAGRAAPAVAGSGSAPIGRAILCAVNVPEGSKWFVAKPTCRAAPPAHRAARSSRTFPAPTSWRAGEAPHQGATLQLHLGSRCATLELH